MIRRTFGLLAVLVTVVLSLVLAPTMAQAQDADPDNPAQPYPGPFGEQAEAEADDAEADDAPADEVLGQSLEAEASTGTQPVAERSIDYLGDDAATLFAAPDLTLDPADAAAAAVGGTGGGLAVTGSEVEPIVAISVGLLAVGGSALVSSRRRLRDFFA